MQKIAYYQPEYPKAAMNRNHTPCSSHRLTRGFWWIAKMLIFTTLAHSAPVSLWQIGDDADPFSSGYNPTSGFSQESYNSNSGPGFVTRVPGDPLYNAATNPTADDHFYLAGTYPAGFNGLTSSQIVTYPEPASAFERALGSADPNNYIHFNLNAAQAGAQSRLRLTFDIVWGGSWPQSTASTENFGKHNIEVRFLTAGSNTLVMQRAGVDRDKRFTIDIPASSVLAVAGANTIQISRTGPTPPSGVYSWIQFDFVKMEVETDALADADGDGLPRWWERDKHLSDSNASDATSDTDSDGLTAIQEYNGGVMSSDPNRPDTDGDGASDSIERTAGSNPNLKDTDADGLTDAEEILIAPTSSPILTDTDSDDAPDGWEKRVGSNPTNPASVPTAFAGSIGLNFVCSDDPDGSVPWLTPAGLVPQLRWNNTVPLRSYNRPTGSVLDIESPVAGVLSKSNGVTVPGMTVAWTSDQNSTTSNNGTADQKLMNGMIHAGSSTPVSLTVTGIPFTNYQILAYVGGGYDGQQASVKINNEAGTVRYFTTATSAPQKEWIEIPNPTTAIPFPVGNIVRYPNRTGSSFTLSVSRENAYSVGIHALQIIDTNLDSDASGIPDWYEIQYALQPAGPATASADFDADGLTNLQEYQRGSNPKKADTDGDGLTDGQESAENALKIDSDGDGLSDYDEATAPLPSNPNLADSDSDGLSDKQERLIGSDPGVNNSSFPGFTGLTPFYTATPAKWEWKLDPIQLVWDHGSGAVGGNDGYDDTLLAFYVGNVQSDSDRSIDMRLRSVNGRLTYLFESLAGEAFSAGGSPSSNIYLSDSNNPPNDLKTALGFSGYGSKDISDKLRIRMVATRGAGNIWAVNFEIFNVTKNTTVVSRLISQSTAGSGLDAGTSTWQDSDGNIGLPSVRVHQGIQFFYTPSLLETLPAFAPFADADNDGMPNLWEDANLLNKNSSADATQDADGDGLSNRDEYFAGTNPRLTDTDGDGVDDRVETSEGSSPLIASLRPLFAGGVGTSGTDFNQNGLDDAWEARFKVAGVSPGADSDGDGASNSKEAAWGTDPFDSKSSIKISLQRSGNDAVLSWTRSPWKRQRIQRSNNLSSWQWLSLPASSVGENDTARIVGQFNAAPSAFFAMETMDRDSDGDKVSDWDEIFIGSDPYSRDSLRVSSLTLDGEGNVTGSVSGDYAAFVNRFKNALPGGSGGQITREQAARFLQQASFGPTLSDINRVQTLGISAWIDDQITNQPMTRQRPVIEAMIRDLRGPRLDLRYNYNGQEITGGNVPSAFARAAIAGQDQLRQRVAFALSQILVTSRRDANLTDRSLGMSDYYDIFVRHAFGNYRDVLGEVALHPAMGRYLSHIGNQKARPEVNQFPDENFARELMQLFTIGLWELNPDGTRKLNGSGAFIPTYNNGDITEMARVFTGLWFGGQYWGSNGYSDANYTIPMSMWPEKHDFEAKSLLGTLSIPARPANQANGLRDIDDALDFLFNHPNTAPFVCRQLIQFLVTGNPSPAYVNRVSAVFASNTSGKRGDLAAVVRAILLDVEARDVRWSQGSASFGRLKDPVQRAMSLARVGRLDRFPTLHWWDYGDFYESALQSPGNSPSVFNFYRPDYRSPGLLTENQLNGPVFQITNSYTSISFVNRLWYNTIDGLRLYDSYQFNPDYKELLEVAGNPPLLVDRANLLFCGGMMSAATRTNILDTLGQVSASDPLQRVQLTVFLACACPEGAVQR